MRIRRATLVDAAIAAAFIVVGQLVAWKVVQDSNTAPHGSRLAQSLLYLALDALVFFWRRAPVPALVAMAPIGITQTWLGGTSSFLAAFVAVLIVLFGVVTHSRLATGIAAGCWVLLVLVAIINRSDDLHYANELPFSGVIVLIVVAVGTTVKRRGFQAHSAIARANALEAERERVLEEERARIARELHDVIAHSVSVVIVQAGAARLSLNGASEPATQSLLAVERAGRQALDEMRRLLGMLRQGSAEPQLSPQPGLGDVGALVEQVRAAGLPVDVDVQGEPLQLAPGVDLTAYRVVQEALTNAIKHAGPTTARLRVAYVPDAIEIEIVDDGRGGTVESGGHGLVGMRERVELYRGTLSVGPQPQGGFRVHARLPVEPA